MIRLLKYLKDYKKECIIGPLFKLTEAIFELIVPLVVASIIDVGIKNKDTGYILGMGGIMVLLGFTGLVCALTAQYFAAKASMGFGAKVRSDLFNHVNSLSFSQIDKIGAPTLITRLTSDVNLAQTGVNMVLRQFLRAPFIAIGAIIMAFTIDAKLALIFVAAAPAICLILYVVMAKTIPMYKNIQKKLDKVAGITRENLSGVRVVRAFSRQDDEVSRFSEKSEELRDESKCAGRISAWLNPLTYAVVNLAIIAIIYFGAKTVDAGRITQGEVVALVNYMTQILAALIMLANLIVTMTKTQASAARIAEAFNMKPDIEYKAEDKKSHEDVPKVVFENVSFSYGGDENSLENINLTVNKGETVGIIGSTGSGKSSLVNLIPRFYDVTQGAVLIDGVDVRDMSKQELVSKVGIVLQQASAFSGTIRENILIGKEDATDEEIYKALDTAQAREFVDSKPRGLDTPISQGGKNLSGGQKQRLSIARAIVKKPEILILDDSASALDYATDAKLRSAIKNDTEGMTVFIVSQRATTIKNADMIVVLDDGSIAGIGTHSELYKNCPTYREICNLQLSHDELEKLENEHS